MKRQATDGCFILWLKKPSIKSKIAKTIGDGAYDSKSNFRYLNARKIEPPIELKVEFMNSGMADQAELLPDATRTDPRIITYLANDYLMAHRAFRVMITLAQSAI